MIIEWGPRQALVNVVESEVQTRGSIYNQRSLCFGALNALRSGYSGGFNVCLSPGLLVGC